PSPQAQDNRLQHSLTRNFRPLSLNRTAAFPLFTCVSELLPFFRVSQEAQKPGRQGDELPDCWHRGGGSSHRPRRGDGGDRRYATAGVGGSNVCHFRGVERRPPSCPRLCEGYLRHCRHRRLMGGLLAYEERPGRGWAQVLAAAC